MLIRQRNEHTIAQSVRVCGRGYWSGEGINVRFHPAKVGSGIAFFRSDVGPQCLLPVGVSTRNAQSLRTVIQVGDIRVEMVEHVLAALYGLEIDNCLIEIDGGELPGLDGSSAAYVDALRSAGLVMQARTKPAFVVQHRFRVGDEQHWVEASPTPDGNTYYEYQLQYPEGSPIAPQEFRSVLSPVSFTREIAPARTFVTQEQASALRSAGLGTHVTNRDLLIFGDRGPVDNLLRYPNECARHKVLDLIGDLSIVGVDLIGCFTSRRGGHQLNGEMASAISTIIAENSAGCRGAA